MNNKILPRLQLFLKMSPFLCGDEDFFLTLMRSIDEKQNIKGSGKETKRKKILFPHKSMLEGYKNQD